MLRPKATAAAAATDGGCGGTSAAAGSGKWWAALLWEHNNPDWCNFDRAAPASVGCCLDVLLHLYVGLLVRALLTSKKQAGCCQLLSGNVQM